MHSLSNHSVLETMDNWKVPKYNFMKHTIMSSVAFKRCIPPSKKSDRIFCVRQVYFTSKSWRQIWWRVNQPFKHTFSHHVSGKQYTDLGQNLFFFALFKLIILQFFTILQDKLHSLNIQDDRSARFLCTTNL